MSEIKRTVKGQFPPGTSGNPGGRPKGKPDYLDILKRRLTQTKWRRIVDKAIQDAENGDRYARAWLSDYALGKPIQPVETFVREELSDELQRDFDKIYGDGPESGMSEGSD